MQRRGGGATNHQWLLHSTPLHFGSNQAHFLQRWGDQTRQADNIDFLTDGCFKNGLGCYHDAQINNFVIIAAENYTNDIFANVVYITLDGRHQDANLFLSAATCLEFFLFNERDQYGYGLLHHTCAFDHLGQKHAAITKQITHNVHTVH